MGTKLRRATDSAWGMLEDAFGCCQCQDDTTGEVWRLDSVEQFHPLDKWMFTFKHRNYNGLGPKQCIIES
tara:strand:- start:99 stop:308 length:210 start_codon:yes stop_codon:yes gene_type:complete